MKKICLLLAISCASYSSFSQKNFQPATVITSNGDRLSGEIDYRNWKENPAFVLFRKDKSSTPVKYGVDDLQSFEVDGDRYKRAVIELYEREDDLSKLSYGDTMIGQPKTVFLLTIVSGPKSLYVYTDNVNHFYIPDGDHYQFLAYKKFKFRREVLVADANYQVMSGSYIGTNKGYLNQLRQYLADCESLNLGDNLKYEVNTLRNVYKVYYSCRGNNPDFIKKEEREKLEIGLLAGASSTKFDVNSASEIAVIGRINYTPSTNFTAGAYFDLVFPRQRQRISFNSELMYSSYQTGGQYRKNTSTTVYEDYTYKFEYAYVKMNNMLRYKFFVNNAVVFINGGISNGMVVKEVNQVTKVHTFNDSRRTTVEKGFSDTKSHELGLIAGAGLKFKRFSFELRAEKGNGPFRASGYKANVMRYTGLLGFRIK